ncbi:MAG TPA: hypothetical protein VF043_14045 [Ktedonobacteraceae bacterium]
MVAGDHSILVIIYHVLRDQKAYEELGAITSKRTIDRASRNDWCDGWSSWAMKSHSPPPLQLLDQYFSEERVSLLLIGVNHLMAPQPFSLEYGSLCC